jgi:hypothetical protein
VGPKIGGTAKMKRAILRESSDCAGLYGAIMESAPAWETHEDIDAAVWAVGLNEPSSFQLCRNWKALQVGPRGSPCDGRRDRRQRWIIYKVRLASQDYPTVTPTNETLNGIVNNVHGSH